jgi:hypothetical protein
MPSVLAAITSSARYSPLSKYDLKTNLPIQIITTK